MTEEGYKLQVKTQGSWVSKTDTYPTLSDLLRKISESTSIAFLENYDYRLVEIELVQQEEVKVVACDE